MIILFEWFLGQPHSIDEHIVNEIPSILSLNIDSILSSQFYWPNGDKVTLIKSLYWSQFGPPDHQEVGQISCDRW